MAFFYTCLVHLALPFALLRLLWRSRKEAGYRAHISERLGVYAPWQASQPVLWLHAVSLGETRAAASLVDALLTAYPQHCLLLTHMTPTGRRAGAELFAEHIAAGRLRQAWLPYDLPWAVAAFLRHFRPALGLLMETEVWPNVVFACRQQDVPLCLVNARLSARSQRRYLRFAATRRIFASFTQILAQSAADAERFQKLGAQEVTVTGNLKFDITPSPALLLQGSKLRAYLQARRVLCAASTRAGEEGLILTAWQTIRARLLAAGQVAPLLWLVPRHPQRFAEVWAQLQTTAAQQDWQILRRSSAVAPLCEDATWHNHLQQADICLGDSLGEMPLYYAASDAVLMGGSLLPLGGQNLIEACAVGRPVLFGSSMFNFAQASQDALAAGAALQVADAAEFAEVASQWLLDSAGLAQRSQAAMQFAQSHRGATARTLACLKGLVQPAT